MNYLNEIYKTKTLRMPRVTFDLTENKILTYDKNLPPFMITEEKFKTIQLYRDIIRIDSQLKSSENLQPKRKREKSRLEIEMMKFKKQLQDLEQA